MEIPRHSSLACNVLRDHFGILTGTDVSEKLMWSTLSPIVIL